MFGLFPPRVHTRARGLALVALLVCTAAASRGAAQDITPPAPIAPAVITRDGTGKATLRAVRLDAPLKLDGKLDDAVYGSVPAISDFIQVEPNVGARETEKTEMWVLFDRDTLYVSYRCWDSHPERDVANEMRRDALGISQNEHVSFILDTFHDKRNMYVFNLNKLGARLDGQMTNETQFNMDFNPVWRVATGTFDGGWTAEAAVPFKSLRYRAGTEQVWGFNARRVVRWKNELSHIVALPAKGLSALSITSLAPTLVGIEAPPQGRILELKPYVIGGVTTDLTATPRVRNDPTADAGVDVKYGLTKGLTADLTYNTDFAQVEADEAQVNLTRFSLFFPEKREFFLENSGIFGFGGAISSAGATDTPVLFYSRRIGLNGAREVPLLGGGRVTGRVGRFELGALDLRSKADEVTGVPAVNFLVGRVKRDLFRKSAVGALVTRRSLTQSGSGAQGTYGVDGTFNFFDNLYLTSYWSRTPAAGVSAGDASYRAQLDYNADRYGVQAEHLLVGARFTPDMGFVRRPDMRKSSGLFRFSPRTRRGNRFVRKYSYTGAYTYIENTNGRVESKNLAGDFAMEFHTSDRLTASVTDSFEFLPRPFRIASGVTLPTGGYDFASVKGGYTFGQQRKISGAVSLERGQFYDGHRTVFGVSSGRVEVTPQFSLQPTLSVNWVDLPAGTFRTTVGGSRITYTMTPLMFVSALVQYNSSGNSLSANVRMRWEYRPGSELFVVYNEQRDTLAQGFPTLANRSFVVKINTLLRF